MHYLYFAPVVGYILYLTGTYVIWVSSASNKEFLEIKKIYRAGFLFQFVISILVFLLLTKKYEMGIIPGNDVSGFYSKAGALAESNLLTSKVYIQPGNTGIVYLYAIIHKALGKSSLIIVNIWSFIASLTVIPTYILAKNVYSHRVARLSSWMLAVYPSLSVLSAVPHKDVLAMFLCVTSMAAITQIFDKKSAPSIVILMGAVILITLVRYELFFILLVVSIVLLLAGIPNSRIKTLKLAFSMLVVVLVTNFVINEVNSAISAQVASLFSLSGLTERVEGALVLSRSKFTTSGFANSVVHMSLLPRTFLGGLIMYIKPFPPNYVLQNLTFGALMWPSTLIIYCLAPYALIGSIKSIFRSSVNKKAVVLLVVLVTLASGLFLGGSQMRYRLQIMPFIIILTAYGFYNKSDYIILTFFYVVLFFMGIILYLVA